MRTLTPMPKTYVIYCEPGGFKKVVTDPSSTGLPEIKTSPVPGRVPVLDKETNKTLTFQDVTPMPKYKCPNCGRGVVMRKSNVPRTEPKPNETATE